MRNDARLPVGWSRPHNPKVAGSNPAPATKLPHNRASRQNECPGARFVIEDPSVSSRWTGRAVAIGLILQPGSYHHRYNSPVAAGLPAVESQAPPTIRTSPVGSRV